MTVVIHPRPNPIVGAMYTLRDMDVDVIVVHGPAGCSFMASRPLENAGVRVVTSAMKDKDLIFGGTDRLVATLKEAYDQLHPSTMAVVGTCASTIIGDDFGAAIKRAGLDCNVFPVNCHGCLEANTDGAIRALEAGVRAGLVPEEECARQTALLKAATGLERKRGMAGSTYLSPAISPTKYHVARRIAEVLSEGGRVAVAMLAKKELAYRFADLFPAVDKARRKLGGETLFVANLDGSVGLPRIRRYCSDILGELEEEDVSIDAIVGGLDEYAVVGDRMREVIDGFRPDLTVVVGICHALPGLKEDDILVTDQPRELANYLRQGFSSAVGEVSSHNMVMGADRIVHLETADTLREIVGEMAR